MIWASRTLSILCLLECWDAFSAAFRTKLEICAIVSAKIPATGVNGHKRICCQLRSSDNNNITAALTSWYDDEVTAGSV